MFTADASRKPVPPTFWDKNVKLYTNQFVVKLIPCGARKLIINSLHWLDTYDSFNYITTSYRNVDLTLAIKLI